MTDEELETMFGEFVNAPEIDILVSDLSHNEYNDFKRVFFEVVRAHANKE